MDNHAFEVTYLNNSRTGNDVVVSSLGVTLGENDVALASNTFGNGHAELGRAGAAQRSPDRASNGDKSSVDVIGRHGHVKARASHQINLRAVHDRRHRGHGEGGESLDGELLVAGRAGGEEGRGDGVDLVEVKGVVEGLGEWGFAESYAEVGTVAGLVGQDAAGCGEVCLVHDGGSGTEVGADTDACDIV